MNAETQEKKSFKSHQNLLMMVMKRQAGSVSKAILEAVQNSLDAGASTVDIKFSKTSLSIQDDGKGFKDEDYINDYFNTFGQPHEAGDATYGYYRVGRGQIFAFLPTTWRTHNFQMEIDIENNGVDWILKKNLPFQEGCAFYGDFYHPLDEYIYNQELKDLAKLVKYAPEKIILNGRQINEDKDDLMSKNFFDYEDDLCSIHHEVDPDSDAGLHVYNQGMYVTTMHNTRYGFSGVIVSKKPLQVNMARNNIQVNECAVWSHIVDVINKLTDNNLINKKTLNKVEKRYLLNKCLIDPDAFMNFFNKPIIEDVNGRALSFKALLSRGEVTFCSDQDKKIGELVSYSGVTVISDYILKEMGCETSGVDFTELLEPLVKNNYLMRNLLENFIVLPFRDMKNIIPTDNSIINEKILNRKEKKVMEVLRAINNDVHQATLRYTEAHNSSPRTLFVSNSAIFEMSTDGSRIINVSKKIIDKFINRECEVTKLVYVLAHEYFHLTDDQDASVSHSYDFYEKFHNMVIDSKELQDVISDARRALRRY